MSTLNHYTLNTGNNRVAPRSEVSDDVIKVLLQYLPSGKYDMPFADGYKLFVTNDNGLLFSVYSPHGVPLVTCAVARDESQEDVLWGELEKFYFEITEQSVLRAADFEISRRPDSLPWLSVVTLMSDKEAAVWLGGFERSLAWAWLETN